ncbi:MAG: hypothetical protein NTX43_01440 [Bacteroidetes bacterium]|nr:hypothetical protein [Bacteroidota bacterium]
MKEKDGYSECPEQQVILYVEKEDGKYEAIQTGSYLSANYLDDFFLKRKNLEKMLGEKIEKGEINAIGYFMVMEDLSFSELAARTGILKWNVRKHLKAGNFSRISESALKKYSMVFNVPVEEIVRKQSENRKQDNDH